MGGVVGTDYNVEGKKIRKVPESYCVLCPSNSRKFHHSITRKADFLQTIGKTSAVELEN